MFANDKGWEFPKNEPAMRRVNPELFALLQKKETYFMFFPEKKVLLLRWDLGEHREGWAFDEIIQIQCIDDHPRKGTCSDTTLKYYNQEKNVVGEVPVSVLLQVFERAGKKPQSQDVVVSKEDLIAMGLDYVSNPDNLKGALRIK